jgi:hypothetical protein
MVSIAESEFLSRSASHWTRPGGKSAMMVEPLRAVKELFDGSVTRRYAKRDMSNLVPHP